VPRGTVFFDWINGIDGSRQVARDLKRWRHEFFLSERHGK
jgi:hypothetical protein